MKLITPPRTLGFPFTYEAVNLPNMPNGPEKDAALAWLALPENNILLSALADTEHPDLRPFVANAILNFVQSQEFALAAKLSPAFTDNFTNIIEALGPEYIHGTKEIPPLLDQYRALVASQRLRLIEHLRSLGFPYKGANSLQ